MMPKFRVFEKERKIMCKVEELVFSWGDGNLQKISYYWEDYGEYMTTSKLGDVVLMQYTGLKDKNGVEIYVGDVVKVNVPTYKTITKTIGDLYDAFILDKNVESISHMEVIGNVYENPEFKKVKSKR